MPDGSAVRKPVAPSMVNFGPDEGPTLQQMNASEDFTRGFALAVEMLQVVREQQADRNGKSPLGLCAGYRPAGQPQRNVVQTYITKIAGNAEQLAGFSAVLTDYLSFTQGGSVPDVEFYYQYLPPMDTERALAAYKYIAKHDAARAAFNSGSAA